MTDREHPLRIALVILIPRTIQLKEGRIPFFSYREYFPTRLTAENPMVIGFANALAEEGAQVDVYLSGSFEIAPSENLKAGVRVVYLKDRLKGVFNPGWMPLNLSLFSKIRKGGYDILVVGDYVQPATIIVGLACLVKRIPLMIWQELDTEMRFPANILSKVMFWSNVKLSLPRIAKFVPRSEKARSFLISHGIDGRFVTGNIPHGVDTSLFKKKATTSWRNRLCISESEIVVLSVSRIEPCKGLDDLVDAARILVDSHPRLRFVIKGSGTHDIELRKHISEAGLDNCFTIVSERLSRDELAELYAESDIFVAPSRTDLLIFSPIEAMSSGLPVIVSSATSHTFEDSPNRCGLVFKAGDIQGLATTIETVLSDKQRMDEMGVSARTWASERYDWKRIAGRYLAVTGRILDNNGKRESRGDLAQQEPDTQQCTSGLDRSYVQSGYLRPPPSLRIAMVSPYLTAGLVNLRYYNSQLLGLGKALVEMGHDVDIITTARLQQKKTNFFSQNERNLTVESVGYVPLTAQALFMSPMIIGMRELRDCDVIQVSEDFQPTTGMVAMFAKILDKPLVLFSGTYSKPEARLNRVGFDILRSFIVPFAREAVQVVTVKTKQAYTFAEQSGYKKIQYAPVGIDTKFFAPGNGDEFRKIMDLRPDVFLVLYVGRIESYRNPDLFLRLLSWSKAEGRNIEVMIIGQGADANEIEKEARRLGIRDRLHIVSRLSNTEVRDAMRACDAFVLPMKQGTLFNFGMVLLEAMSCGVPTISAPVPAAMDIIDNGRNGFVMPFDDINALGSIISRLMDDRELRARIGEEGRKTMTALYDWSAVSQNYEKAYIEAISLHRASES